MRGRSAGGSPALPTPGVQTARAFFGRLLGLILLAAPAWWVPLARAQLTLGRLEGSAEDRQGAAAGTRIEIEGPLGWRLGLDADTRGHFSAALPYGVYTVRAGGLAATCVVRIRPLATARCDFRPGQTQTADDVEASGGAVDAAQALLEQLPGAFSYPLDFASLDNIRLPVISFGAASWTGTTFRPNGLDATDSYQPGTPVMLDDATAEDSVVARAADHSAGVFLRAPESSWHGGIGTEDTSSDFAASNLPPATDRGIVERPEEFLWYTRDTADLGFPIGRWADFSATATGQWAYQTAPQRSTPTPIGSRMLFANPRGQVRLSARDRVDALYSGSRLDLSNGGFPAGIQAILANRVMPSFYGVKGFQNLHEVDHFDLVQAGWTHQFDARRVLEVRYGYSTAHLDTSPINGTNAPSQFDLLDPAPADAPLSNFAVRTRHQLDAWYQAGEVRLAGMTHRLSAATALETSQPRNRFQTAGGDLISAAGQAAFVVRFNGPTSDNRDRINSFAPSLDDSIEWAHGITLDVGLGWDAAHGYVPGEPGGISWSSPAPRAGIAIPVPRFSRLVLRGSYARTYAALAGRFLDFGDPDSLSGQGTTPRAASYYSASGALIPRSIRIWNGLTRMNSTSPPNWRCPCTASSRSRCFGATKRIAWRR